MIDPLKHSVGTFMGVPLIVDESLNDNSWMLINDVAHNVQETRIKMLDEQVRVVLKPKPRWIPQFVYKRLVKMLIHTEHQSGFKPTRYNYGVKAIAGNERSIDLLRDTISS